MRRRRKRIRIDRIVYCLLIFVSLIFLIRFSIYSLINLNKYNSVKDTNIIKINKKEIKVWKKTINYINEKTDTITIKHKKNSVTIDSNSFRNGLNVKLNTYNKNIDEALFDNVKSLYIEKTDILSISNKIKIKLPRYLYKHNVLDVYGVKNGEIYILKKRVKVEDKYITFNTNSMYDDYFITYVKAKSISSSNNITMEVGDKRNLNIKINPANSTSNDLKYEYDKKIISINGDVVTALKKGETTIKVTMKNDEIDKEINIKVKEKEKEKEKETIKEENEEKHKVEVIDGVTYIDGIMIVNKSYSLPSSYNPGGLTDEYMNAFYEMQAAAALDNIHLFVASGFRDYDYQVELYNKYVQSDGKENADTYSARPGYSEHQTGLAADINAADESFNDTPEAKWLDENCYKYGFIIRFPKGKEAYTGYVYESWHLRYVGKEFAKKIHDAGGISLEEYFGITSVYKD